MITAFAGSKAAEGFLLNVSWRWGIGSFAIMVPVICAPLFIILKLSQRKGEKHGIIVKEQSGRTLLLQKIWNVIVQFDGELKKTPLKVGCLQNC